MFDLLRLMAKVEGGETQTRRRGRLAATTREAGTTYLVLTATTPRLPANKVLLIADSHGKGGWLR